MCFVCEDICMDFFHSVCECARGTLTMTDSKGSAKQIPSREGQHSEHTGTGLVCKSSTFMSLLARRFPATERLEWRDTLDTLCRDFNCHYS